MSDPPSVLTSSSGTKRKRSVIACAACHRRKVRCDVALHGVPCNNCHQDGAQCEVYRRRIGIPGQGPSKMRNRQEETSQERDTYQVERSYPFTPSPASGSISGFRPRSTSSLVEGGVIDRKIAQTTMNTDAAQADDMNHTREERQISKSVAALGQTLTDNGERVGAMDVEPYFAGESEGLEFLFDQCAPDRPVKGVHYVTPRKTYRNKRTTFSKHPRRHETLPMLPDPHIQKELVRCFFHYVYPVMPVIDAGSFLEAFEKDPGFVSPLLLWSIFFAGLNYIDTDLLRSCRLPPRKILKEQYYQNAKDLYDSQRDISKTVLIASCLYLASYYIDLEDRDGSWYWIGNAISLCHTIGLHRASNYASIPAGSPFPAKTRNLWRRMWWCTFYREAWLAQGFGRPMRLCIDDCDEVFSTADEILSELEEMPRHLIETWLPNGMTELMDAWVVMIRLGVELAEILRYCYRPKSPTPSTAFLKEQETRLLELRAQIPATNFSTPAIVLIHICHLEMYFNGVLITLYRPLISAPPDKVSDSKQAAYRQDCLAKAKVTASDTSNILNKLMSLNSIDRTPSSVLSALMASMQILVYDVRTSRDSLAKGYATHQLDLHQLVLGHLRKTYWTADLQHNLFIEVLKVLNGEKECEHSGNITKTPANERSSSVEQEDRNKAHTQQAGIHPNGPVLFDGEQSLAATASLDEYFFGIFNPFMGLPAYADDLGASVDWDLSPSDSLALPTISEH